MCDHNHHHNSKYIVSRVIIAAIVFGLAFLYKPLFILAYIIAGYDVLWNAFRNIIKGHLFDENFLMGIATIGAFCIKEYPEAVMVMILFQIGEYFSHKAVHQSRDSITKLMDIRPDYANLNGIKVDPKTIKIGDIITVKTGEKVPLDGIITEGSASIDMSALTGESIPKRTQVNDEIFSGVINLDGILKIKVTKLFGDSTVSKILELVENSALKKSKSEKFITKFAKIYTPIVVLLALIIAFVPSLFFDGNWIERALTFLVISCPCALVISIPLSFFAGIGRASKDGILIKGSNYIEALSKPSKIFFDKTGTLTKGVFKVVEINSNYPDFLKYVAYSESASSHPIAKAIIKEYGEEIPEIKDIQEVAGMGIIANIDGKQIKLGKSEFIETTKVKRNGTIVYVSIDNQYAGYIVISDEIKEEAFDTITSLNKMKINTEMLTGDTENSTEFIKNKLGIQKSYAELLPIDKVKIVENSITNSQNTVIFVGDGINDAPVLTRADIGIAMGGLGSDAAIEAANIVIMDDKISKVTTSIKIAQKTMRIVKENIIFVLFIKVLFLTLGGLGMMTMWGAVFADVGISLLATLNSLRIIKKD